MAALTSASITVAILDKDRTRRHKQHIINFTFGDGALTYPTGGIPFTMAQLGFNRDLDFVSVVDGGILQGYVPTIDTAALKIKLFAETTVGTNQPLIEATTALAPAATTIKIKAVGW